MCTPSMTLYQYWYLLYNVVYITVYFCFDSGWLASGPPCVRPLRQLWNVLPPNRGAVCGRVRIQHDLWDSGRIFRWQIVSIKQALVIFLDYVFLQVLYSALKNLEYKLNIFMQWRHIESSFTILIVEVFILFIFSSGRRANTIVYGILYGGACITKVGEIFFEKHKLWPRDSYEVLRFHILQNF